MSVGPADSDQIRESFARNELTLRIASAGFVVIVLASIAVGIWINKDLTDVLIIFAVLMEAGLIFALNRCPNCDAFLDWPRRGWFIPDFDRRSCRQCGVALMP